MAADDYSDIFSVYKPFEINSVSKKGPCIFNENWTAV